MDTRKNWVVNSFYIYSQLPRYSCTMYVQSIDIEAVFIKNELNND